MEAACLILTEICLQALAIATQPMTAINLAISPIRVSKCEDASLFVPASMRTFAVGVRQAR